MQPALQDEPRRSRGVSGPSLAEKARNPAPPLSRDGVCPAVQTSVGHVTEALPLIRRRPLEKDTVLQLGVKLDL